jgi:cellulose synthase/poly-beta-1,6-N-acetylglucosamine synthase-like glycosyltransferase
LPGIPHQQRRDVSAVSAKDARPLVSRPGCPAPARPLKLSILMPAYNEQRTIVQAISEVLHRDYPCDMELIVVDDGSTDRTEALLSRVEDPRLVIHRFPANQGKGAALLAAASFATGTHILPFDADLEYSADDIPKMVEPILKGRCDVVYGVRLFGCNTVYRSYRYAVGNRLLTRTANILFNACLSDLHTCLKLMPLAMLRNLKLMETGFGLDSELTAVLLRRGVRPFEVPVSYYSRSHAEGKKITWRDAVECMWILLRVRFRGRSRLSHSSSHPESDGRPRAAVAEIEAARVRALAPNGDGDELSAAATG